MWAAVARSSASKKDDAWQADVGDASARALEALARAYRELASRETREIDFDDQPTPVVHDMTASQAGMLEIDDDPTDPDTD